jgi:hypothetical protein
MRALIVYESMFGNTRQVAEQIAAGLAEHGAVTVLPVQRLTSDEWMQADLIVVGGPTHVHGMSRPQTRKAATKQAAEHSELHLERDAEQAGLREWLAGLDELDAAYAAFDTRMHGPAVFTGRAGVGIDRRLRWLGGRQMAAPMSFLVGKDNTLDAGEAERAREWGDRLGRAVHQREAAAAR